MSEFEGVADKHKLSDGPFGEVFRHTQNLKVLLTNISQVMDLLVKFLGILSVNGNFVLELDFEPFTASFPKPTLSKSIGSGVEFLNRHLSAKMFLDKESMRPLLDFLRMHPLLDFLRMHHYKGRTMMLNDRIQNLNSLQSVLRKAEEYLNKLPADTPYSEFDHKFQEIGLERGWGDTALRVHDTIQLILDLLKAPDFCTLEKFLGRISMVSNVVILSPRSYFSRANVLVCALENEMLQRIKQQGLDIVPHILIVSRLLPDAVVTTCGQRLEEIFGTKHSHILRVPFRTEKGIVRRWISRFEDVANEIFGELRAKPDLIIGNYSDGNIVASLLAHKLGVTQCTIAHALEKTTYPNSDIYWKSFEEKYHFSCQFTADLIAMNHTDFIITSTFQEIAGKTLLDNTSRTQLSLSPVHTELFMELAFFTLNSTLFLLELISDQSIYFPYTDEKNRLTTFHPEIEDLLYSKTQNTEHIFGGSLLFADL
ncbi:Sucrose synthase [Bienertia sinuspersici]